MPKVKKTVTKKKTATKAKKTAKKATTKKVAKKTETKSKVVKKTTKTATKAKKVSKTTTKAKKESSKTAEKIIAKAKKGKAPSTELETAPAEKNEVKKEAQKNVIYVKKASETNNKVTFKVGDYAVYPSHGVGQIVEIESTIIVGQEFKCYLMYFEKEKLTIKIPTVSAEKIGLRHLVTKEQMDEVFSTLRSGIKKLKGMWSRRAQEYETKINSGDIMLLAEVLRDLTRDIEDGDRSYSERIIYETAVYRLAAEYSAIYGCDFEEAKEKVISTAKDKLGVEGKITQKDEFDEFDYDEPNEDDEDEEDDDEDDEDDDEMYEDDEDEDDEPRRRAG